MNVNKCSDRIMYVSVKYRPFQEIIKRRTDQRTDRPGHTEVSLPNIIVYIHVLNILKTSKLKTGRGERGYTPLAKAGRGGEGIYSPC